MSQFRTLLFGIIIFMVPLMCSGQTLRICNYNVRDRPTNSTERSQLRAIIGAIGSYSVFGNAQAIDLMAFQEGPESLNRYDDIVADFETVFGGNYAWVTSQADFFGCRTGFIYRTDTVTLNTSQNIGSGMTHNALRATFTPVDSPADQFTIYSLHLKAGFNDQDRREDEATIIRNNADSLGQGTNIIYLGDLNVYRGFEPALLELKSSGNGKALDTVNFPFGLPATMWNENLAFLPFHTQEPKGNFGGMDDRFDLQLVSEELGDGVGLELVRGSVRVLGNNGTHTLNQGIDTGTGGAGVQNDLMEFTDHLPVFADYRYGAINTPANVMENSIAAESFTVRTNGPATGSSGQQLVTVRGTNHGGQTGFGIIDFSTTGTIADDEIAIISKDVSLELTQITESFCQNGPMSVYLASPTASGVVINNSINYQSGNNGLDCLPSSLSNGAIRVSTYPAVSRTDSGSLLADGTKENVAFEALGFSEAISATLSEGSKIRFLIVPDHAQTSINFAGYTNPSFAKPTLSADIVSVPYLGLPAGNRNQRSKKFGKTPIR